MENSLTYEEYFYHRVLAAVDDWSDSVAADVYVMSLSLSEGTSADSQGRELPLQSNVAVHYNTIRHFENKVANVTDPMRRQEYKWLIAHWVSPYLHHVTIPTSPDYGCDPVHAEWGLRDDWCRRLNLPLSKRGAISESGWPVYDEIPLKNATIQLCENSVKTLHTGGALVSKLRRAIPVLIQADDYSAEALAATERANPSNCLHDYVRDYEVRYAAIDVFHFGSSVSRTDP